MLRKPVFWIITAVVVIALAITAVVVIPRLGGEDVPGVEEIDVAPGADESAAAESESLAAIDPSAPAAPEVVVDSVDELSDLTLTTDATTTAKYSGDFQVMTSEFFTETGKILFAVVPVEDKGWFSLVGTDSFGNTIMWTAPTREEAAAQLDDMLATNWTDGAPEYELVDVE